MGGGSNPVSGDFLPFTFARNVSIKNGFPFIYMSNFLQFKRRDSVVLRHFDKAAVVRVSKCSMLSIGYL